MLKNVGWLSPVGASHRQGDNCSPSPREVVCISFHDSSPTIIGSKRLYEHGRTDNVFLGDWKERGEDIPLDDFFDLYCLDVVTPDVLYGGSRPRDQMPGDRTTTGEGGVVVGTLGSGSWIAKCSSLAQIFVSKIDDIVRVVTRNYEQYSDTATKNQTSLLGRLYQYHGHFKDGVASRTEAADYFEVIGDVVAGETAKDQYRDVESLPAEDMRVKLQQVDDYSTGEAKPRWVHTLDKNGVSHRKSLDLSDSSSFTEDISNTEYEIKLNGGATCTLKMMENGTLAIKSDTYIHLGDHGLEPLVMGDKLAAWVLQELKVWLDNHQHIGNMGIPTSAASQGPYGAFEVGTAAAGEVVYSKHNFTQP